MNQSPKVSFLNINGAVAQKRSLLREHIRSRKVAIMGLVETFLKPSSKIKISGFQAFAVPRTKPRSGGVAILIRSDLAAKHLDIPENCLTEGNDAVMASVRIGRKDVQICVVYCRPRAPLPMKLLDFIVDSKKLTILLGDFNARHHAFRDHASTTKGRQLLLFLLRSPMVGESTRELQHSEAGLEECGLGSFQQNSASQDRRHWRTTQRAGSRRCNRDPGESLRRSNHGNPNEENRHRLPDNALFWMTLWYQGRRRPAWRGLVLMD